MEKEKRYLCYLNGKIYGDGDMAYMTQLFTDYFLNMEMYGRKEASFKVVENNGEN